MRQPLNDLNTKDSDYVENDFSENENTGLGHIPKIYPEVVFFIFGDENSSENLFYIYI